MPRKTARRRGRKAADVVTKLEAMKLGKAAQIVREGVEETLCYMAFPDGALASDSDEQSAGAHHA